jgi:hypothetical protein
MRDPNTIVLDEEAMQVLQEDPNTDIFEEEEEDTAAIMSDANLRLEQGRLYQMVLQGNIFADTNADPKAIRIVQREIRKFVKEKMELMLGIRQEKVLETIVSSPFNDMEVTVLRMLASKMSKGATEEVHQTGPQLPPATPKKDGITSISGNLRPQTTPLSSGKPLSKLSKNEKGQNKQQAKSAIAKEELALKKPISEMTQEELAAHDAAALARRSKNYAAIPNNLVPHPNAQTLEMMYTAQVNQNPAPGSAVARMTDLINGRTN